MITIDSILTELFQTGIDKLDTRIPNRDKKILNSLAKQVLAGQFLTENQSSLLLKIFKENRSWVPAQYNDAIDLPAWSRPFRIIEHFRRISLTKDDNGKILVEFTYNKRLRQQLSDLSKQLEGQLIALNSKQYSIPLTEKNLHLIVKTLKNQGFEIDHNLMIFYEEISEILKIDNTQFNVFSLLDKKLETVIINEVGVIVKTI